MKKNRDKDNCFRFVEPVIDPVDTAWFEFRILKGHTIGNLMKQRNGALHVYFGLACMGMLTVMGGEEMIRDCLVVDYVG
jgi:hypothetical protein